MAHNKNLKGILGESFVKKYCKKNNIDFKESSEEENIEKGIDCYIDGSPTDIKNTDFLYFLNLNFHGDFVIRHPFRKNSEATHYCFVEVNGKGDGSFKEFVKISKFLKTNFFKSEEYLKNFLETLQKLNGENYKTKGVSVEQAMFKVKTELSSFLKEDCFISYEINEENLEKVCFRILKTKKELKKKVEITKKKKRRDVIEINL